MYYRDTIVSAGKRRVNYVFGTIDVTKRICRYNRACDDNYVLLFKCSVFLHYILAKSSSDKGE